MKGECLGLTSSETLDLQNASDNSRSWSPAEGGLTQMSSMTLPCFTLAEFTEQAPWGLKEETSIRGWAFHPPSLLTPTGVHVPDKGRKAQSLLIKSALLTLIERSLWNKGLVSVLAEPPLLIDLPLLPLGQTAALPESSALPCSQQTGC